MDANFIDKATRRRSASGGLVACAGVWKSVHRFSHGCRHALLSHPWKGSVVNGKCEILHVRQQSEMLIISPNRCTRSRFAVCVCIRSWGVSSKGAARVRFEYFDRRICFSVGNVLLFDLSYIVQSMGANVYGRQDFM